MRLTSFKNAEYICRQLEEEKVKFDCVISTSRPFINCFTAFNIVKKWKIPWLLDQRDLPYTDGTPKSEINAYKYALRRFDSCVSKYTLVSKGMADSFIEFCKFGKKQEDKTPFKNVFLECMLEENYRLLNFYEKEIIDIFHDEAFKAEITEKAMKRATH